MTYIKILSAVFLTILALLFSPAPTFAATTAIKITDPIATRFTWPPGEVYVDTVNKVNYQSGRMVLSSTPDGTGDIWAEDAIDISVTQVNKPITKDTIDFDPGCADPHEQLSKDETKLFYQGDQSVQIKMRNICGGYVGAFALYLVHIDDSIPAPSPVPTPTSTPVPAKTPLIFIPGIGGSELKANSDIHWSGDNGHGGDYTNDYRVGEQVWVNNLQAVLPGNDDYFDVLRMQTDGVTSQADLGLTGNLFAGAYGPTIQYFTDNGYTLNKDLFVFPYDWRKDVATDVPLLDQKIAQIKQQTGANKVDLVAHSMGGLVGRSYIADAGRAGNVRKYISLGTPYLGATNALDAIIYGNCLTTKELQKIENLVCLGLNNSEVKDVLQNSSAAYQLAPSQTYYNFYNGSDANHPVPFNDGRDIDNNGITGALNYSQIKDLLSNLKYNSTLYSFNESLHSVDNQNFATNGVDTTFIVGSGQSTDGQLVETNRINLGGIKLIPYKDILSINGDGTTPLFSGSLNDSSKSLALNGLAKIYYANLKHEDLPSNNTTLGLINNILQGSTQIPSGISTTPYLLKGTQLSVHSPVNIDVYDSLGNHTGLTPDGNIEENILGSSYETLDDAKFIWLPNDGKYTVKFSATDQGSFAYKVRAYNNDQIIKSVLFNDVPLTTVTKGQETLDTTASQPDPLQMDENGDGTTDLNVSASANISGSEFDDHTPPEAKITYNPETQNIEVKGIDNVSNVLVTNSNDGKIILNDDNGNTTTLMTDVLDKKKRNKIQLQSIAYNQNPASTPSDNRFVVVHKLNKDNSIQQFDQRIIIKGDERLLATYDPKTNKTRITTKEKGQERKVEFRDGIVALFLNTNNGNLVASY